MSAESTPRERWRVAVILLNYRTPKLVLDCLATLVPEVDRENDLIVVVDNASGDGSVEKIEAGLCENGWKSVRLLCTEANGGFAAGNNFGIRAVDADAYLLLNSDTLIRPGAVEGLWSALQADSRVGVVSPRLECPDGEPQTSCFRFPSVWSELIRGSVTGPIRWLLARYDVPMPAQETAFDPEWTSFAAVLIRRQAFEDIGGLDEGYFMYFEDVDACRRVRKAGWLVRHDPRSRVVHLGGGSSPVKALAAAGRRRPHYFYASRTRYFRAAYGTAGLWAANVAWTIGRALAWLRESFAGRARHAVDGELLDVWRG